MDHRFHGCVRPHKKAGIKLEKSSASTWKRTCMHNPQEMEMYFQDGIMSILKISKTNQCFQLFIVLFRAWYTELFKTWVKNGHVSTSPKAAWASLSQCDAHGFSESAFSKDPSLVNFGDKDDTPELGTWCKLPFPINRLNHACFGLYFPQFVLGVVTYSLPCWGF